MKKHILLLVIAVALLSGASAAVGQKPARIKFKKGTTEATVSGNLDGYDDKKVYLVRLRRGQTLQAEQIKSENSRQFVTVSIKNPAGEYVGDADASCNNRKIIEPTAAGDYRITVTECRKADPWRGSFRLKITAK